MLEIWPYWGDIQVCPHPARRTEPCNRPLIPNGIYTYWSVLFTLGLAVEGTPIPREFPDPNALNCEIALCNLPITRFVGITKGQTHNRLSASICRG
jgi:hypothetical protein